MTYIELPDDKVRRLSFYLAMEEHIARQGGADDSFFMWQVEPSVIFGRNQQIETEVNVDYCLVHNIRMYRRKSGGGCVYADMNNIMFSYVTSEEPVGYSFSRYLFMIVDMLKYLGVDAAPSGRNDIIVEDKKVSGNAFYHVPSLAGGKGRNVVHGTMLYDTNMENMVGAITPPAQKLESKGIQSVRQRITLLKDYIPDSIDEFKAYVRKRLCDATRTLTDNDIAEIEKIEQDYLSSDFIFGKNPKYSIKNNKIMANKRTCLYERHEAMGALIREFGGFDMPIQYSTIVDEHNAVRNDCGVFDVSHMGEVTVRGKDAERWVNHIFTNDVKDIPVGKILYGMMCYDNGGTVDDLLVYKMGDNDFFIVINAANIDKDWAWMNDHKEGFDIELKNLSDYYGQLAIQGPNAEKVVEEVLGLLCSELVFYTSKTIGDVIVSRTGYTGEDGFEVYADHATIVAYWDKLMASGRCKPCGLGCRDTLRFEVGLPLYGDELSAEISPVMAGLSIFCKLDKQEFIGKDALAAQKTNGVGCKLIGIELADKAIPRHGYAVVKDGEQIGEVTTGYHTISTDKSVCMALVKAEYGKLGTLVEIQIRKKMFAGTVVKKKFYEKHYKK